MNSISELVKSKKLQKISQKFQPKEVAESLSFKDGMMLGYQLLLNEEREDSLREYAVNLIEEIFKIYPKEWESDWRNEVFLGDAYYLVMNYQKRYEAYLRAAKKYSPTPPALLISLAGCYLLPNSPITLDEAEKLVLEALKEEKTVEGAILIRGIYKTKEDREKFIYWDEVLKDLEHSNAYLKDKWPKFLFTTKI